MRRGALAAAAALFAVASLPAAVLAATWSLTVSPQVTTVFVSTTYMVAVTDMSHPSDLGCFVVSLPSGFVVEQVGVPTSSSGFPWISSVVGQNVIAQSANQAGRLKTGETISFTVRASASQVGTWSWVTLSHRQQDCSGPAINGSPVSIVVQPVPATPTPAPVATPAPTAAPEPSREPGATATPRPSASPAPSSGETPRPGASVAPTESPPFPTPSSDPTPSSSPAVVARLAAPAGGEGGPPGLGTASFELLDGPLVWFVPGAAVGVPGLMVLAVVGLQAAGALAWIPFVRRLGGGAVSTRRRRRRSESV
jgi:hypothetical protein